MLSASSEAVGVLIRALQTAGRLQVLSSPKITTLESQEASTVLVGSLVPRVTGITNAGAVGGQTVVTEDTEVGLGLAVVPRVNQDGLIVMNIQIFNSQLDEDSPGIPIGFSNDGSVIESPIINTTQATTWISAYSGQTVVFAGLISKNRASLRRQIPVLGSLPWIGAAFRYDVEAEERRELLVVMTPRIIQTDDDVELLKQIESSRMSWCLADVQNIHGGKGLSGGNGLWGPAKSNVIYPDLQPAVIEERAQPFSGRTQMFGEPLPAPIEGEMYPNMSQPMPGTDINNGQQAVPYDPNAPMYPTEIMNPQGVVEPAGEPTLEAGAQIQNRAPVRPAGSATARPGADDWICGPATESGELPCKQPGCLEPTASC